MGAKLADIRLGRRLRHDGVNFGHIFVCCFLSPLLHGMRVNLTQSYSGVAREMKTGFAHLFPVNGFFLRENFHVRMKIAGGGEESARREIAIAS